MSPDDTRIAFKRLVRRVGVVGPLRWRVSVLDLKTLKDSSWPTRATSTTRSNGSTTTTSSYGLPQSASSPVTDVWKLPAAGGGHPERVLTGAWSPAVVRG